MTQSTASTSSLPPYSSSLSSSPTASLVSSSLTSSEQIDGDTESVKYLKEIQRICGSDPERFTQLFLKYTIPTSRQKVLEELESTTPAEITKLVPAKANSIQYVQLEPVLDGNVEELWKQEPVKVRKADIAKVLPELGKMLNELLSVTALHGIIAEYYVENVEVGLISLDTSFFKSKILYALEINSNFIFVEWRNNKMKQGGKPQNEIPFRQPGANGIMPFSILEEKPIQLTTSARNLTLINYEDKFGQTKKPVLKTPHVTLDERRKYQIRFLDRNQDQVPKTIKIWEMDGPSMKNNQVGLASTQFLSQQSSSKPSDSKKDEDILVSTEF